MLQNYSELSKNELYALCQIWTTLRQYWTNCTPSNPIYCTPYAFLKKGYTLGYQLCRFLAFSCLLTKT